MMTKEEFEALQIGDELIRIIEPREPRENIPLGTILRVSSKNISNVIDLYYVLKRVNENPTHCNSSIIFSDMCLEFYAIHKMKNKDASFLRSLYD